MKNIFAVCPNPSVDLTLSVEKLNIGGLNRVPPPEITCSGKAINALKAASILGVTGTASGFMPENDAGDFSKSLAGFGCDSAFVSVGGSARRNIKLCDSDGTLTEFNSKGEPVGEDGGAALLKAVQSSSSAFSVSVVSGSLPPDCPPEYYGELLKACRSRYRIVDADGERLMKALPSGATLIKPNREEAEKIVGFSVSDGGSVLRAARVFISAGAEAVLLSAGGDGAYITDGEALFFAEAPKVKVRSSVGAGDCMVGAAAAFLSGFEGELNDDALYNILRSAVAAGSASVSTPGTNLFEKAVYDRLFYGIKPIKI